MSTTQSGQTGESAVAERRLEATEDGYSATIAVRGVVDSPLVVRVVDDLPGRPGVDGIRLSPDAEPARWTVADGQLVFETLVPPEADARVVYDVRGEGLEAGSTRLTVELAQPVDAEALEAADAVPAFRDARSFDAGAAGEFVSTDRAPDDEEAASPTGDAHVEATDDDVRRAVESVTVPESDRTVDEDVPTIDLDEPGQDGE